MNPRLIVLAVLLFMSCSCSLPGRGAPNSSSEQTPGPAVGANAAAYEVKVTKDGAVLAAYSDKGPRAFAMFDGKMLLISLDYHLALFIRRCVQGSPFVTAYSVALEAARFLP